MSSEALAWAFRQDVKSSSVKFTLVALCECANYRTGRITPSIEHLTEITGQNRKTIIANVAELERSGLIVDTGERVGRTKQIKVYQAQIGTVPKPEQSQERNSSEFDRKQSQKRDTEPSYEPSSSTKTTSSPKIKPTPAPAFAFDCPAGVDPIDWDALKQNRKAKRAPLTEGAHRQITRKLEDWSRAGWPPGPVVAFAAERGWTSVFETDEMKAAQNGQRPQNSGSHHSRSRPVRDTRDGVAKALDRRLGLDGFTGEIGRRNDGEGAGYSPLSIAPPDSMR